MVTKIVNPTSNDIEFYTTNINSYITGKAMPPIKRVVKAGETLYSRSVTGDTNTENYLMQKGCTLTQVRRNMILIIAGQSNAVGYDETPWEADDVKPLPYCYFEAYKNHGGYSNASAIPMWNPGVDTYQDMQNVGSVGTRTKGIHYELAKRLIGLIPEDYELELWGYAYGMSGMCVGNAGSVNGQNLPEGSTKWNSDGALTQATGRRLNSQLGRIQPESKLLGFVWCQGEYDGMQNITPDAYSTGFQAMVDKIQDLFAHGNGNTAQTYGELNTYERVVYERFAVNTKTAHNEKSSPENDAAFVSFTGGWFVAAYSWKYFDRTNFSTNLTPEMIDVKYSSTAPTLTPGDDATTLSDDCAGKAIIDFYNVYTDGRVRYMSVQNQWTSATRHIYAQFVNKLNNKYIGYVIINWSHSDGKSSPNFDYTEANLDHSGDIGYPLWIAFPGPQAYWDTQGTFSQIMQRQKDKIGNFVDLPKDLPTNDCSPTGTKRDAWNYWNGYGFTSQAKASHYGQNSYKYIADKVYKQIQIMFAKYGKPNLENEDATTN